MSLFTSSKQVTTYDDGGKRRIYVAANSGALFFNYWDGSKWRWADQGAPAGGLTPYHYQDPVAVISYPEGTKWKIYAFMRGLNGLAVNYWDGQKWHWAEQGLPTGEKHLFGPVAITYREADKQRIYCFVYASGKLHVHYWDGAKWHWATQGSPPGTQVNGPLWPLTFEEKGIRRIYCFAKGGDGHLYVNFWDGSKWRWADQGTPSNTSITEVGSGVSFVRDGMQHIYCFAVGEDRHLYVNYWDGLKWRWADQGAPPTTAKYCGSPTPLTYHDGQHQRIYCFLLGEEVLTTGDIKVSPNHLAVNYWDGQKWHWADQGVPATGFGDTLVGAVSFPQGGTERIYAFCYSPSPDKGVLRVNFWDGSKWSWAYQSES